MVMTASVGNGFKTNFMELFLTTSVRG
jgi:hypothetical protein